MTYKITNITIQNFKTYKYLNFDINSIFSIVVGENNIGKTTIFEALLLWETIYKKLISSNDKAFNKANTNYYLNFNDLFVLRNTTSNELFFDPSNKSLSISVTIEDITTSESFILKIALDKPKSIDNAYFRIYNANQEEPEWYEQYERFASYLCEKNIKLSESIFIYQTKPISNIPQKEPFYNNAQVLKKIFVGKSLEVLRNKLLKTRDTSAKRTDELKYIEEKLHNVFGKKYEVRFKNINLSDDEYIRITAREENSKELEISLYGSGFLQVLEIFSTLKFLNSSNGLNILLIDEPDSHIHSNIQASLIDELRKIEKSQIFVISHNDRFIQKSKNNELYFLNKAIKESQKLQALNIEKYQEAKEELGGLLYKLEYMSNHKLTIFVEGETDEKYLQTAIEVGSIDWDVEIFWIGRYEGKNAKFGGDSSLNHTKEFILSNPKTINKPVILLYDSDTNKKEESFLESKLYVRTMPKNEENSLYKVGIENLLCLESDFEKDKYFDKKEFESVTDYGEVSKTLKTALNKTRLCDDICNNYENKKEYLNNMIELLKKLKEEIEVE